MIKFRIKMIENFRASGFQKTIPIDSKAAT